MLKNSALQEDALQPAQSSGIGGAEPIAVAIRIRPLNAREIDSKASNVWDTDGRSVWQCQTPTNNTLLDDSYGLHHFTFDLAFDCKATNQAIYNKVAKRIVLSSIEGINGTVFVYGQTASGKTWTMEGVQKDPGIIPTALKDIFATLDSQNDEPVSVNMSYLEIYNENIKDLLNPNASNATFKLRTSLDSSTTIVEGVKQVKLPHRKAAFHTLAEGSKQRQIGNTNMNEYSSRSHTILTLTFERQLIDHNTKQLTGVVKTSRLNLVDLAGSERVGHTGAEGQRLKEGAHINKSLLALSSVIQKLSQQCVSSNTESHIPYRDSKLTRLLQGSLGGNSRTAMVCTITPASTHLEESVSTLKFAMRAKDIENNPTVNVSCLPTSRKSENEFVAITNVIMDRELRIAALLDVNRNLDMFRSAWVSIQELLTECPTKRLHDDGDTTLHLSPPDHGIPPLKRQRTHTGASDSQKLVHSPSAQLPTIQPATIDLLISQIAKLIADCDAHRQRADDLAASQALSEGLLTSNTAMIAQLDSTVAQLNFEISQYKTQAESLRNILQSTRAALDESTSDRDRLNHELDRYQSELRSAALNASQLNATIALHVSTIAETESGLELLQTQLNDATAQSQQNVNELESLHVHKSALEANLSSERDLGSQLSTQVSTLQVLANRGNIWNHQVQVLEKIVSKLSRESNGHQVNLAKITDLLAITHSEYADSIAALNAEIAHVHAESLAVCEASSAELTQSKRDLQAQEERATRAEVCLEDAQIQIIDLQRTMALELEVVQSELKSTMDSKACSESELAHVRELLAQVEEVRTGLDAELVLLRTAMNAELEEANSVIDELRNLVNETNARVTCLTADVDRLQAELLARNAQIEEQAGAIVSANAKISALESQLEVTKQEHASELAFIQSLHSDKTSDLDQVRTLVADLNADVRAKETQISKLNHQMSKVQDELTKSRDAWNLDAVNYQNAVSALESDLANANAEIARLTSDVLQKDQSLVAVQETAAMWETKASGRQAEIEQCRASLAESGLNSDRLEEELAAMTSMLHGSSTALVDVQDRAAGWEATAVANRAELDKVREALAQSELTAKRLEDELAKVVDEKQGELDKYRESLAQSELCTKLVQDELVVVVQDHSDVLVEVQEMALKWEQTAGEQQLELDMCRESVSTAKLHSKRLQDELEEQRLELGQCRESVSTAESNSKRLQEELTAMACVLKTTNARLDEKSAMLLNEEQHGYNLKETIAQQADEIACLQSKMTEVEHQAKASLQRELQLRQDLDDQHLDFESKLKVEAEKYLQTLDSTHQLSAVQTCAFQDQIADLQHKLGNALIQVTDKSNEMEFLTSKITELKQHLADELKAADLKLDASKSELKHMYLANALLTDEIELKNNDLVVKTNALQRFKHDLDKAVDQQLALHREMGEIKLASAQAERRLVESNQLNDELSFKLGVSNELNQELSSNLAVSNELNAETVNNLNETESQREELCAELNQLKIDYQNLSGKHAALNLILVDQGNEIKMLSTRLDDLNQDLTDQMDAANSKKIELETANAHLLDQLDQKNKDLASKSIDLSETKLELESIADERFAREQDIMDIRAKLDNTERQLDIQTDLMKNAEEKAVALEREISSLHSTISSSDHAYQELSEKLDCLQTRMASTVDQCQAVESELAGRFDQIARQDAHIADLVQERDAGTGRIGALTSTNTALKSKLELLDASIERLTSERDSLEIKCADLGNQCSALSSDKFRVETDLRQLQSEHAVAIQDSEAEISELKVIVLNLEAELKSLNDQLETLAANEKQYGRNIRDLADLLAKTTEDRDSSVQRVADLQQQLDAAGSEISTLTVLIRDHESELLKFRASERDLVAELEKSKLCCVEYESKLNEVDVVHRTKLADIQEINAKAVHDHQCMLDNQAKGHEDAIKVIEAELLQVQASNYALAMELEKSKLDCVEYQWKLEELEAEYCAKLAGLEEIHAKAVHDHQCQLEVEAKRHAEAVKVIETELLKLQDSETSLTTELEKSKSDCVACESKLEELDAEYRHKFAQLQESNAKTVRDHQRQLEAETKAHEGAIKVIETELLKLQDSESLLTTELEKSKSDCAACESKLKELDAEYRHKLGQLQESNTKAVRDHQRQLEAETKAHEGAIKVIETELLKLQDSESSLTTELEKSKSDCAACESKLKELDAEYRHKLGQLQESNTKAVRDHQRQLEAETKAHEGAIKVIETELKSSCLGLEAMRSKLTLIQRERDDLLLNVKPDQSQHCNELTAKVKHLESQLNDQLKQVQKQKDENVFLKAKIMELDVKTAHRQDMQRQVTELTLENKRLAGLLDQAELKVQHLAAVAAEPDQKATEGEFETTTKSYSELIMEVNQLLLQISDKDGQVKALEKRVRDLSEQVDRQQGVISSYAYQARAAETIKPRPDSAIKGCEPPGAAARLVPATRVLRPRPAPGAKPLMSALGSTTPQVNRGTENSELHLRKSAALPPPVLDEFSMLPPIPKSTSRTNAGNEGCNQQ